MKKEFLTVFSTYGSLEIVKKTLPSVIKDTKNNDAALIVYDTTDNPKQQGDKWKYLKELNKNNDFFLVLSTNLSVGSAKNIGMKIGQEIYMPDYICVLDDDHGFKDGMISGLVKAMKSQYGKKCPNGLRYGFFTGCSLHRNARVVKIGNHSYPHPSCPPGSLGGTNGCFRCAPTSHWNNVLLGWDKDEYLISTYQTGTMIARNYNQGFTTLIVNDGKTGFSIENAGRGTSHSGANKLWDKAYTASDKRSKYIGKK